MAERVPADHETVATHRVRLETVGPTGRPEVALPAETATALTAGDSIRLCLSGTEHHAVVRTGLADGLVIRGAYANSRLAREGGPAANRLTRWRDGHDLEPGAQLLFDDVTTGFLYGLRRPGEHVVYPSRNRPAAGLADIARSLEEGEGGTREW